MGRQCGRPARTFLTALALCVVGGAWASDDDDYAEEYHGDADEDHGEDGAGYEDAGAGDPRTPSAVYVMEHGFLTGEAPKWHPRGTLLLSGAPGRGGFEARLSDAKEFVQLKPELQQLMSEAAGRNRFYSVRMYSPESPRRVLQASIPAKLLANHFEDWHDILEVSVGSAGVPVGLSYRVKHTLGLALFDHTQVHLSEPSRSEGPRVPPSKRGGSSGGGSGGSKEEEQSTPQSLLRRYWWVILLLLLLASSSAEDPGAGKGGGGAA